MVLTLSHTSLTLKGTVKVNSPTDKKMLFVEEFCKCGLWRRRMEKVEYEILTVFWGENHMVLTGYVILFYQLLLEV